jgi:hypothetical protein
MVVSRCRRRALLGQLCFDLNVEVNRLDCGAFLDGLGEMTVFQ